MARMVRVRDTARSTYAGSAGRVVQYNRKGYCKVVFKFGNFSYVPLWFSPSEVEPCGGSEKLNYYRR